MWKLAVLFTIVPVVETFLLVSIGARIGPLATVTAILLTGVFGAWAAKREGVSVLRRLANDFSRGVPPGDRLMEGVLVVVGGLLLITPGVLTDLVGLALVWGPTRRRIVPRALAMVASRFSFERFDLGAAANVVHTDADVQPTTPFSRGTPFDHPVR